ncbi:MAG: hydantoinase/oxoprolinase family protein [Dehalococcoidia bacterium]
MTSASSNRGYRLGVDVGGTFTDIVLMGPEGQITVKKVSSTPSRYDEGIITGVRQILEEAGVAPEDVEEVCHSTTAATNAVLEHRGAKVGLITTKGFRDVLELRRLRTPSLYDLFYTPPEPLVPRYLRLEVDERIDAQGKVLKALDLDEVRRSVDQLLEEGVESMAVCLLNSYKNPVHEQAIGSLIRGEYKDLFLSLSHDVVSAIGEYERTSTTVANAYLMPVMSTYLSSLRDRLTEMGVKAPISVMQSSGGMMTSHRASQRPVFSLESGPVAGVSGAMHLSKKMGLPNILTFDMGGTTTKAAVIEKGEPHKSSEYEIGAPISRGSRLLKGGGYLLMVRAVDVAEVGAGGGSIVSLDRAGSFQVGPRSAGAEPGPICYDRGGTEPTTSDANVLLGYLNPDYLLGGALRVNLDKTTSLFQSKVAQPLGLSLLEAAYGVHMVANATMARAMRSVTIERGRDARNFTVVAFGGSGPCHAAALARQLGIRRVIVPASPGLFSSLGLLSATQEYEFVRSLMLGTRDTNGHSLEESFTVLESEARDILHQEGYAANALGFTRYADLHYAAQIHELTVPVPASGRISDLEEVFGEEHHRTYGYQSAREPIEITNIRVMGHQIQSLGAQADLTAIGAALYGAGGQSNSRKAYFGKERGLLDVPIISRGDLDLQPSKGPAIVEEYDTTIVVPPGCTVSRDATWNVILQWEQ